MNGRLRKKEGMACEEMKKVLKRSTAEGWIERERERDREREREREREKTKNKINFRVRVSDTSRHLQTYKTLLAS